MPRYMRRIAVVLTAVAIGALSAPPGAAAASRGCGTIDGWRVSVDAESTTCGLGRSATRSFLRRVGQGAGTPGFIYGRSPKTGRVYRFRLASDTGTQTTSNLLYRGRAGAAVLRVRIRSRIY